MGKTNFAAISRVDVRNAAMVFHPNRAVEDIAADCAVEALRVLHDGLSNPDDKLRLSSATAILNAHCKLAAARIQQPAQLDYDEKVEALRVALQQPAPELAQALHDAGYEQQLAEAVPAQLPESK